MPKVTVTEVQAALVQSVREQMAALQERARAEEAALAARLVPVLKAHSVPLGAQYEFKPSRDGTTLELEWRVVKPSSSPIPPRQSRRRRR